MLIRMCNYEVIKVIISINWVFHSQYKTGSIYAAIQINTEFLQISLFYADFDGISEKSTFRGYLISRNQQKFEKLAKISTREN